MVKMKTLLVLILLSASLSATAACPVKRPGDLPVLPDGAVASKEEMHEVQLVAENYLLQAETYLGCGVMNRRQHTMLSVRMDTFAEAYNEELIEFQVRSQMIAEK
jgi:hypothetical protein